MIADAILAAAPDSTLGSVRPIRLAQVANFMGPTTGGLGVVVDTLGRAHLADGGERLLVLPAQSSSRRVDGGDSLVCVASPRLPRSGHGYHVLLDRRAVVDALEAFGPDLVEVHDQTTLAWVGTWARAAAVPTVVFAHERMDRVGGPSWHRSARVRVSAGQRWAAHLAARFDAVVCASSYAAEPFLGVGADNVHRIPFGVDLDVFRPHPGTGLSAPGRLRLVITARLYPEKAPDVAVEVLARLLDDGCDAELLVVGSGPMEAMLRRTVAKQRLPVQFAGHITDRSRVAQMVAGADIALAPGPRETFGLSVLEAMACGTPVVVHDTGAARELLTPESGRVAHTAAGMTAGVQSLAESPAVLAAAGLAARRRAGTFSWKNSVAGIARLRGMLLG